MTPEIIGGIVRTVIASVGGALVAAGYVGTDDLENATSIVGAIVVAVTGGWSIWQKYRSKGN
jgi:ABC-type nickel/cobalt efflux system permease component RcnA